MELDFLKKLMVQKERTHNSFFENIYFPGISVCYTELEDAVSSLETELDINYPRVVFEVRNVEGKFVEVHQITQNPDDMGMCLKSRM
jgi:hypothetical protein